LLSCGAESFVFQFAIQKYKDLDIQNYIITCFLYGCENWSLTWREELRLRASEKRGLRRRLGPTRDEVTGKWRKLHSEELNALYSSPNIVRVITSRKIRWAGHVARMGERRDVYRVLEGNQRERNYLEDPGVDGRIIVRWIFSKWDLGVWTGLRWLRIGIGGGHL
jgi:hypothetical protein